MEDSINNRSSSSFEMNESVNIIKNSCQTINYQNMDINDGNANTGVMVTADNVTIIPSAGKHAIGSSKVKLKNVVDYSWEHKFYAGQILAIHVSGTYIAYGIQSKDSGIIRVINLTTSERALIKGIDGMTQDVAFAFIMSPILLACIDASGDVYVYTVEQNQLKTLTCILTLHIKNVLQDTEDTINRIVWCPYVPDDDEALEDDDPAKLIVTRGNKAHLWNVNVVRAEHGISPVSSNTVTEGFLEIEVDNFNIVDVAFSPDGSTVALACSDGGIRFFQVDVQGQNPVCIHDWRPHDSKPVSCLFFLDNHLDSDCHFWKFAVTGVEGNTELKIWTCETWSCLQTIKYAPIDDSPSTNLKLKVAVDITANFILISDMQRKLLHVLQLQKNNEETTMRIHMISEFSLSSPILSFGIVKAKKGYFSDESLLSFETSVNVFKDNDRSAEDSDERNNVLKSMIKLYLVQPKALHECIIVYDSAEIVYSFNESKMMANDLYEDVVEGKLLNGLSESNEVKLLTPSDFNSVSNPIILKPSENFLTVSAVEERTAVEARTATESRMSNELNRRSLERDDISHRVNGTQDQDTEEECNAVDMNENGGGGIVSTGSSPSREVQNILFSSEAKEETCSSLPVKTKETEIPSTVWPEIPIPEPETSCPNIAEILRINSSDQKRLRKENSVVDLKTYEYPTTEASWSAMNSKLDTMESRFNQLSEIMKTQQQEMKQSFSVLHQQLLASKEDEKKNQRTSTVDDRYMQDRLVNSISQNVNSMIGTEVEYLIKREISGNVLPSLKNTMDTFGQQLHSKLSQHLTMADQQLKEYIIKTVHKKSVTDALANTLASVLPTVISSSFAEVFCNTILPKFEKSCHEMFDQVNGLFIEGTRDFVNVFQNHAHSYEEKQCSVIQQKMDEFIVRLNEATEAASFSAIKALEPELLAAASRGGRKGPAQ